MTTFSGNICTDTSAVFNARDWVQSDKVDDGTTITEDNVDVFHGAGMWNTACAQLRLISQAFNGTQAINALDVSGALTVGGDLTVANIINSTSQFVFQTVGVDRVRLDANRLRPLADDDLELGGATTFWSIVRAYDGDFADDVTVGGDLTGVNAAFSGFMDVSSTEAGITASTTQSQGEQPLTTSVNRVSTVANPNDVVTAPAASPGRLLVILNDGSNTLQIFPAAGDNIGAGADTSVTLSAGVAALWYAVNSARYLQIV